MQRRQLSERRAKEAASSLIREVAGKKEIDSGSAANKQVCLFNFHCFASVHNIQPISVILVHRLSLSVLFYVLMM